MYSTSPYLVPLMIAALAFLIRREFTKLDAKFEKYDTLHGEHAIKIALLENKPPCYLCQPGHYIPTGAHDPSPN